MKPRSFSSLLALVAFAALPCPAVFAQTITPGTRLPTESEQYTL